MISFILPLILIVLIGFLQSAVALGSDREFRHHQEAAPNEAAIVGGESFEDPVFPPPGYEVVTSGLANTWERTEMRANTGIASALMHFGPPGLFLDEWLILPPLDTTSFAGLVLAFSEAQWDWQFFGFEHGIYVSTTGSEPADFSPFLIETPATHPMGDVFEDREIDLGDFVGFPQVHVAFRYQGNNADAWFIDDVLLFEPIQHDIGIDNMTVPRSPQSPEWEFLFQICTDNNGSDFANFDVETELTNSSGTVSTQSQSVMGLGPGDRRILEFTETAFSNEDHWITARVDFPQDEVPDNNEMTRLMNFYTQEHRLFGVLNTDMNDPNSTPARIAFDNWLPSQGTNVSFINTHIGDMFYIINPLDNEHLYNMYRIGMQPPDFVGDNTFGLEDIWTGDGPVDWELVPPAWEDIVFHSWSPLGIYVESIPDLDKSSGQLAITVDVVDPLQAGLDYYLYSAITEDNADGTGQNQTLRIILQGIGGTLISHNTGPTTYYLDYFTDPGWVEDNLHFVTWVIEGPYGDFGRVMNSHTRTFTGPVSAVGQEDLPTMTSLTGVSPNPFNPATKISFSLAAEERTRIAVYDVKGRVVAELADQVYPAGHHTVVWNGRGTSGQVMSSGVYFAQMKTGDSVTTQAMTLVK